jgi:polyphosphate kinase
VLAQAEDRAVPLLERLQFLCIVSSNLDEFFEIRLSGVKEQIKLGAAAAGPDGMTPLAVFRQVAARAAGHRRAPVPAAERGDPARARQGGHPVPAPRPSGAPSQQEWIRDYFFREMMPLLTPIGLDPAHPFPRVFNKSLNFAGGAGGARRLRARFARRPSSRPRACCRA